MKIFLLVVDLAVDLQLDGTLEDVATIFLRNIFGVEIKLLASSRKRRIQMNLPNAC